MSDSPPNPNIKRNRVPEGEELALIRARISHLKNVVDRDTLEADEALAVYEAIRVRYEAHLILGESLQSQLHAAKKTADSLKRHTVSLQADMEELRGLIHPIRRCSDDVLQIIFEFVAIPDNDDDEGYDHYGLSTVTLSHVCRRWRDLSLSTPKIWSYISFPVSSRSRVHSGMVAAFIRRVQQIPAKIFFGLYLNEMSGKKAVDTVKEIPFSRIYRLPNIASIVFYIVAPPSGPSQSSLFNGVTSFPTKSFGDLRIYMERGESSGIVINDFISRFPSFHKMSLRGVSFGPITTNDLDETLTELEHLHLIWVRAVPLRELLQRMPKLQTLEAYALEMRLSPGVVASSCTLVNLRSLDVARGDFPWAQINCPNLVQLSIGLEETASVLETIWSFISRTKSITEVKLGGYFTAEHLARLGREAAQLERLHLTDVTNASASVFVDWRGSGLESPPFPHLLALKLQNPSEDLLPLTLDNLIRARCFIVGHPESTMEEGVNHALKEFRVKKKGVWSSQDEWLHSQLLRAHFSGDWEGLTRLGDEDIIYFVDFCYWWPPSL